MTEPIKSTAETIPARPSGYLGTFLAVGVTLLLSWTVWRGPARATADAGHDDAETVELLERTGVVFGRVAQAVAPAVVYIESRQREKTGDVFHQESGSGVLIQIPSFDRPVVVTNLHVVEDAKPGDVDVILADGLFLRPSRVLTDRDTDLAVLDLEHSDLPSARLSSTEKVRVGQWVLAIGSPFGLMQSVTHGIVSATDRRQLGLPQSMRIKEFIQTDAAINPGSSGGPLINLRGEVIGINTAIASHTGGSSGVGFAIPAAIVAKVAEDLVLHGRVRRAYLGVEFPNVFDHKAAERLGLPAARGALVASVSPLTPAAKSGIRPGDVILEFDGREVDDDHHLINLVSQASAGSRVHLTVWRDKKLSQLEVTLGDWEAHQVGTTGP